MLSSKFDNFFNKKCSLRLSRKVLEQIRPIPTVLLFRLEGERTSRLGDYEGHSYLRPPLSLLNTLYTLTSKDACRPKVSLIKLISA
jgi:hypothetical protein